MKKLWLNSEKKCTGTTKFQVKGKVQGTIRKIEWNENFIWSIEERKENHQGSDIKR